MATVIPDGGSTTTQRPLIKIVLNRPVGLNDEIRVFRNGSDIGQASLSLDQAGSPGTRFEFRDSGLDVPYYDFTDYEYIAALYHGSTEITSSPTYTMRLVNPNAT